VAEARKSAAGVENAAKRGAQQFENASFDETTIEGLVKKL
jgi:hypothetical protein